MAAPVEFWFDFISPYGYFASTRIEALALRYGRTVNWRPLRLGVRHYLAADADGMLHIIHSRLTRVWATEEEEVPHDQVA